MIESPTIFWLALAIVISVIIGFVFCMGALEQHRDYKKSVNRARERNSLLLFEERRLRVIQNANGKFSIQNRKYKSSAGYQWNSIRTFKNKENALAMYDRILYEELSRDGILIIKEGKIIEL